MKPIAVIDQIRSWRFRIAALGLALEGFLDDEDPMLYAAGQAAREIFEEMYEIEGKTTGVYLSEIYWDRHTGRLAYAPNELEVPDKGVRGPRALNSA
ncbi:MAG: hypothetical protein KKE29_12845 [Proteobacteria bacterium]|nr:hypothetical protein [Pseudomonadota bacterium]MBU4599079.1 hypothetical protein [Pseudomonadota bacterium]MBV1714868.1 hypothetical protein [Desulfarculus sp.]